MKKKLQSSAVELSRTPETETTPSPAAALMPERLNREIKTAFLTLALALFAVTFAGCGNGNSAPANEEETGGKLNPPAWFTGKWVQEDGNPNEDIEVTAHNVTVSSGNLDFSYQIERALLSNFKETLNGNAYTLSYITKNPAGEAISYTFEPHDGGKMKRTLTMSSFSVATHIFVRK